MKILIISNTFYPRISPRSFRTTELAKEFARQGHIVKVIIPNNGFNYDELMKSFPNLKVEQTKKLKWRDLKKEHRNIIDKLVWKIRWILVIFFEYPSIEWWVKMPKILRNEKKYDLLISVAVPHTIHWGVARCFSKNMPIAKKWIADCGDPFMGVKTSQYKHPFYFKYFEKSFCKQADYIAIPEKSAKDGYYKEFNNKIRVIPQAFNFEEVNLRDYKKSEKKHFCYAGAFYRTIRDPRPLLDALIKTGIDFEFTVFTSQHSFFKDYNDKLIDKLILKDYIPRLELIEFMSSMDFLINLENGTSTQIPSKLIDYSLSGRPTLSLDSQNFDEEKLLQFLNGDYSQQYNIPNIEDYNIKNVTRKFLDLTKHKYNEVKA